MKTRLDSNVQDKNSNGSFISRYIGVCILMSIMSVVTYTRTFRSCLFHRGITLSASFR
mgnify:CR=1 FL=1